MDWVQDGRRAEWIDDAVPSLEHSLRRALASEVAGVIYGPVVKRPRRRTRDVEHG